jgi:hypothetical protein
MTRMANEYERADRERDYRKHEPRPSDPPGNLDQIVADMPKRHAVAMLVGYCEGVCSSGVLNETGELQLRRLIAETLAVFNMPSKRESADA